MAWVAFRAPWGELLGGATHAGVGSPRRSANTADRPTPPGTLRAGGGTLLLCLMRCVDARPRANSWLGRRALISPRKTHPRDPRSLTPAS